MRTRKQKLRRRIESECLWHIAVYRIVTRPNL